MTVCRLAIAAGRRAPRMRGLRALRHSRNPGSGVASAGAPRDRDDMPHAQVRPEVQVDAAGLRQQPLPMLELHGFGVALHLQLGTNRQPLRLEDRTARRAAHGLATGTVTVIACAGVQQVAGVRTPSAAPPVASPWLNSAAPIPTETQSSTRVKPREGLRSMRFMAGSSVRCNETNSRNPRARGLSPGGWAAAGAAGPSPQSTR